MQVDYTSRFEKRFDALRDDNLRLRLRDVVLRVESATTIRDIPNLKKLKGHQTAYRIRVGDFRIGLFIEGDAVIFADFDHRKDIYSRFP
jgi:mRNA interferase RelE/StbE